MANMTRTEFENIVISANGDINRLIQYVRDQYDIPDKLTKDDIILKVTDSGLTGMEAASYAHALAEEHLGKVALHGSTRDALTEQYPRM